MKKILVFCVFLFLLTSCFNKEKEIDWEVLKIDNHSEVKKELSKEEIKKQRWEISLDDLDLLLAWENLEWKEDNELFQKWKEFLKNLDKTQEYKVTERIDWGIELKNFEKEIAKIPENLKREINLDLDIVDYKTKEKISSWVVYMNKIRLWEFTNWKFEKKFYWPIWIEQFKIMVRNPEYGDWFLNLNSINSNWSLIIWEIYLKKAVVVKNFDLDKDVDYSWENLNFSMEKCSLVDKNDNCYRWKVEVKINHIFWQEVNNWDVSLNMKALTKEWKLLALRSWGMAFIDFITDEWDILQLKKWKEFVISYKQTKKDTENMTNFPNETWVIDPKSWYWWYDKNRWLWIETKAENIVRDIKNHTWTAIVKELY